MARPIKFSTRQRLVMTKLHAFFTDFFTQNLTRLHFDACPACDRFIRTLDQNDGPLNMDGLPSEECKVYVSRYLKAIRDIISADIGERKPACDSCAQRHVKCERRENGKCTQCIGSESECVSCDFFSCVRAF